ncbi:RDD family protein [Salibacterium halotolerans]|uniref:RDD family protein n=1 Tax=Salibacterium halotolerans TaxID=1884432 RepID=A0A1I5S5L8_9BACI|nr:RDD family protein [Salibacterium halotolerans]SFP66020.1 RDD family protein [Salibacterium halotolerans]
MHVSHPAGVFPRINTALIDISIIFVLTRTLAYILYGGFFVSSSTFLTVLVTLYWIIIPSIWRGRTIGKWICGLTIASVYREGAGFGTMLLRYTGITFIVLVTLGVGLIVSAVMMIWRDDRRTLHDFAAGTYVTTDAPEPLQARTIFNNRRALAAATIALVAGMFAFDRWEHTTYEDAAAAMLENVNGPVETVTLQRYFGPGPDQMSYSYTPESKAGVLRTLTDAPQETIVLRRTDYPHNFMYRISLSWKEDFQSMNRAMDFGTRGITLNGRSYTFIGNNPTEEIINRFNLEWETDS